MSFHSVALPLEAKDQSIHFNIFWHNNKFQPQTTTIPQQTIGGKLQLLYIEEKSRSFVPYFHPLFRTMMSRQLASVSPLHCIVLCVLTQTLLYLYVCECAMIFVYSCALLVCNLFCTHSHSFFSPIILTFTPFLSLLQPI